MRRLLLVFLASLAGPPEYALASGDHRPAGHPAGSGRGPPDRGGRRGWSARPGATATSRWSRSSTGSRAPDLRPSGAPNRTNDITPHAGAADFDDSGWTRIAPAELETRRSHGTAGVQLVSHQRHPARPRWRTSTSTGATVVFELVIDDYAEIWVDGKLPVVLGQTGGHAGQGVQRAQPGGADARDARPGQKFQIAVFGVNGPISSPPANFIWIRSATLDFYGKGKVGGATQAGGSIVRLDPALDAIVAQDAKLEKLAGGFQFTEGPVWHPDGYLLFSDPNANTIYRWSPEGAVSVFRSKSGYSGFDIGAYRQPGSNGLTLDRNGPLTINEHGNRRVTRLERDGQHHRAGRPVRGQAAQQPERPGVSIGRLALLHRPAVRAAEGRSTTRGRSCRSAACTCWRDGKLTLLTKELSGPNGIAFSPDEHYLYVEQLGPEAQGAHALRGEAGRHPGERAGLLRLHQRAGGGRARRGEGGPAGKRLRLGAPGRVDPVARGQGAGHGSSRRSTTRISRGATRTRGACT